MHTVALCRGLSARLADGGLRYTSRGDTVLAAQSHQSLPAPAPACARPGAHGRTRPPRAGGGTPPAQPRALRRLGRGATA